PGEPRDVVAYFRLRRAGADQRLGTIQVAALSDEELRQPAARVDDPIVQSVRFTQGDRSLIHRLALVPPRLVQSEEQSHQRCGAREPQPIALHLTESDKLLQDDARGLGAAYQVTISRHQPADHTVPAF